MDKGMKKVWGESNEGKAVNRKEAGDNGRPTSKRRWIIKA